MKRFARKKCRHRKAAADNFAFLDGQVDFLAALAASDHGEFSTDGFIQKPDKKIRRETRARGTTLWRFRRFSDILVLNGVSLRI